MAAQRRDIGVLGLQGDFEAHAQALARCGIDAPIVKLPTGLDGLRGLVLPGGESTTLLRLIREYGFDDAIPRFAEGGGALFGTCAGAILLARAVTSPTQWSFGLLDIEVERNGYGPQIESFETRLTDVDPDVLEAESDGGVPGPAADPDAAPAARSGSEGLVAPDGTRLAGIEATRPLSAVFIRAPRIRSVGPDGRILASRDHEPVLVREGRILVSTFHPELTTDTRVHRHFIALADAARAAA